MTPIHREALTDLPWFDQIPADEREIQITTIKKVKAHDSNSFDVTSADGWTFLPKNVEGHPPPKPGNHAYFFGRGIGYTVRGFATDTALYFYRTEAEQKVMQEREFAEHKARMRAEHEAFTASRDDTRRHTLTEEAKTGFSVGDDGETITYEQWREKNNDPYGRRCFTYAEDWALLLEEDIAAGRILADHARQRSHEADMDGITGYMYGVAVSILSQSWVHGDELRRWHNLDTQLGTEGEKANEVGTTLNPALLSVSVS